MNEMQARQDFKSVLTRMADQFKTILPSSITPERFVQLAVTATQTNPKMLEANRSSVIAELMKCARDGLIPDGREAFINCYKDKAQYIPMVQGIIKKVRLSGELVNMHPEVVHANDKFRYWIDDEGPHILHEPSLGERGEPTHTYCVTNTKNEGRYIDVLSREEVMIAKSASTARNGPWQSEFELEMWKKTAIRRQAKRLPLNTDLDNVIRREDEVIDADFTKLPQDNSNQLQSRNLEIDEKPVEIEDAGPGEREITDVVNKLNTSMDSKPEPMKGAPFSRPAPKQQPDPLANEIPQDHMPDKAKLVMLCKNAFQKLGFTTKSAGDFVKEKMRVEFSTLDDSKLFLLYYQILLPIAQEKGITL